MNPRSAAVLLPSILAAFQGHLDDGRKVVPWFTGPLIGSSGNVISFGHFDIQPYVTAFATSSFYNQDWESIREDTLWKLQYRVPTYIGFAPRLDFKITPVWNWNTRSGQSEWTLGDWNVQLGLQLWTESAEAGNWLPSAKFLIREIIPLGKYQKLNPQKRGTDSDGFGSWRTACGLNLSKLFYFGQFRFLALYLDFLYSIPTCVSVQGFNAYGGGYQTHGTVKPDRSLQAVFAFEYALSRNWAIACDVVGLFNSNIRFSGNPGFTPSKDQNIDPVALPASNERDAAIQYSLAPAIEYNWSENLGLIAGAWFTVAGKNIAHFTSGVVSLNYYH